MGREMLSVTFLTEGEGPVESETTFAWSSPYVLSVHTTIEPARLAVSVHSSYIGHPELPTLSRHLLLGPAGHSARYRDGPSAHASDAGLQGSACVFEHCQQILELLRDHGLKLTCEIADRDLTPLTHR
jgi:hypothetical protein